MFTPIHQELTLQSCSLSISSLIVNAALAVSVEGNVTFVTIIHLIDSQLKRSEEEASRTSKGMV